MTKMHPTRKKILESIKKNPNLTVREIGKDIGIKSEGHVQHHLYKLQIDGYIKQCKWRVTT